LEVLEGLNPSQKEAVTVTEGPVLVLAGAGSGKTRVLTHRIAYLLKEKAVDPESILAITFTNKAAGEMKERLQALIGPVSRWLWVNTFHAACVRILRQEIAPLGYRSNFVIYDTADQLSLIKNCLKELNLDDKKFPPSSILNIISKAKNRLLDSEGLAQEADNLLLGKAAQVYGKYQAHLKELNGLDFDDLLMLTVELFKKYPQILRRYQQRFRYILVDEYQDTNHAQYVLIRQLAAGHRNLFVVGDPDQSIYGWRGANLQNILDFQNDYPEARVIKLEQNYRSTQIILEAANQVISHNLDRKPKALWTKNPRGKPLLMVTGETELDEAAFVAGEIYQQVQQLGRSYRDFAVLYRTNAQSRVLEEAFIKTGIPYEIIGGIKFYERKEIKDILAYLKVLYNPLDAISLRRIINIPRRGIGEATWASLEKFGAEKGLTMYETVHRAREIPGLSSRFVRAVESFARLMDSLEEMVDRVPVTELVENILEKSGYLEELKRENTLDAAARLENLQEFLSVTYDYDRFSEEKSLEGFLAQVSLVSELDEYEENDDKVVLMTLHSAKGLEFPVVFLTGLEEGIFPHARSLLEEDELEEERRLCYVGMTRAREELFLSRAWQRTLYGAPANNPPSRFLAEIPAELVVEVREGAYSLEQEYRTVKAPEKGPERKSAWQLGDKVNHPKWGVGVIVKIGGEADDPQLSVAFPNQGIKVLLARFAPLSRV
jgi:DNA helicase-2/ATP-dependent DNA helicase PcrA